MWLLIFLTFDVLVGADCIKFDDPKFTEQWYLGADSFQYEGRHNNVIAAWKQNATGKGVLIGVVDNGVENAHKDLMKNLEINASWDFIRNKNKQEPYSDNTKTRINGHGTMMAGIIGMNANDSSCGVGVAFDAKLAGIKIVGEPVTDAKMAAAYSHLSNEIDIYSSSYGPSDNGKVIWKYTPNTRNAIIKGIQRGRHGYGSIYVQASGHGKPYGDHCGADGAVNSIYSIAVASAARDHKLPYYSEECSSILTTAYSQHTKWYLKGYFTDIITTGLESQCVNIQGGSSASTAIVSGIIALALSVNPKLSWRDIQYLIVKSSSRNGLQGKWIRNGVNLEVSHQYGFGILDAGMIVNLAKDWTSVTEMKRCYSRYLIQRRRNIAINNHTREISYNFDGTNCKLSHLEQVSIMTSFRFSKRGDVSLYIVSPSGTTSEVLGTRPNDWSTRPYYKWRFTSVHYWGEKAAGIWKLIFKFKATGYFSINDTYFIMYGVEL